MMELITGLIRRILASFTLDTSVLTIGAIVLLVSIARWNRDPRDPFRISNLVIGQDERASLDKLGQLVALCVSTWGFVYLIRAGLMSEYYCTGYMLAWGSLGIAKAYILSKSAPKERDNT